MTTFARETSRPRAVVCEQAWKFVAVALLLACIPPASAQTSRPAPADDSLITLNLPENVDLTVLVNYVGQRLGMNIVYDETIGNRKVTIGAPVKIPQSTLLPLLESVLKMKGLALIDTEPPGWKRVVAVSTLNAFAQGATQPTDAARTALAVTQIFPLNFVPAKDADATLKPFLTQPGGNIQPLPDQRLLIVTDYASNMPRIQSLLQSIDRPGRESATEFVPVRNADVTRLTQQLKLVMSAKAKAQGATAEDVDAIEVINDPRTNQLAVIGPRQRVAEAVEVIRSLDVPVPDEQNPVRFYKLANATVADVLTTLKSLEGQDSGAAAPTASAGSQRSNPDAGSAMGASPASSGTSAATGYTPAPRNLPPGVSSNLPPSNSTGAARAERGPPGASADLADAARDKRATVVADNNTNTIIVIAEPSVQKLYEQLIRTLDKRRPQVLIEATVVTLDTSHGFSLGVEIGGQIQSGSRRIVNFSSFGLSTPDPTTGRLALIPGLGFNGALLSSDIADVVLRALTTNSRARVVSSPRVLVNDNMVGHLSSLAKAPYTSTNALTGNTATTSFGGYAEAGTDIIVTPHISESDYLQLEYEITLSSFTGDPNASRSNGVPPPQTENKVSSKVTIPDGDTIVVGGLNIHNVRRTIQSVPLLGDIPLLKYLFRSQSDTDQSTTLFVFIRPVILRDDQFTDLKFFSARDVTRAGAPGDFPASEPLQMR